MIRTIAFVFYLIFYSSFSYTAEYSSLAEQSLLDSSKDSVKDFFASLSSTHLDETKLKNILMSSHKYSFIEEEFIAELSVFLQGSKLRSLSSKALKKRLMNSFNHYRDKEMQSIWDEVKQREEEVNKIEEVSEPSSLEKTISTRHLMTHSDHEKILESFFDDFYLLGWNLKNVKKGEIELSKGMQMHSYDSFDLSEFSDFYNAQLDELFSFIISLPRKDNLLVDADKFNNYKIALKKNKDRVLMHLHQCYLQKLQRDKYLVAFLGFFALRTFVSGGSVSFSCSACVQNAFLFFIFLKTIEMGIKYIERNSQNNLVELRLRVLFSKESSTRSNIRLLPLFISDSVKPKGLDKNEYKKLAKSLVRQVYHCKNMSLHLP